MFFYMIKVRKIAENIWEIPKEGDMNVPGRVFASDVLMSKIKEDLTLEQVRNAAKLPGVVQYSIAMPDAHQGYGLSVGGVVAFDFNNGIVSPGGVGYDINCTHPETAVSLNYGTWLKIEDLEEKWNSFNLKFSDLNNFDIKETNLGLFMKREENGYLYEITSKTGDKIKVTGDHPIFTKDGMKNAKELTLNDMVVIHSFVGNNYEEPSDETIISEKDFENELDNLGIISRGNAKEQIINWIKKRDILPLRYNSKHLPILLKIMGFIFGDGYLSIKNNMQLHFYGKKDDLDLIKADLESIGFKSNISSRERNHRIITPYGERKFSIIEHSLRNNSAALCVLLYLLGIPSGNKSHQRYRIPRWIFNTPLWQKRLFLATFFGAEMSSPKTSNKYNFHALTLSMNKSVSLKENAIDFLNDIRLMLVDFDIKSNPPVLVPGYSYKGKLGATSGYRFQILSNPKNYLQFVTKIGYEYNKEKQKKGCLAANYIRLKEKVVNERNLIREQARELYKQKIPVKEIISKLEAGYATQQFIEHSVWSTRHGSRVAFEFISFEEYCQQHALGNAGLAWDEIEKIEKTPYSGLVYDITINDKNHNFIANGFIVSNCGVRLLSSNLSKEDFLKKRKEVTHQIMKDVPSGVGKKGDFRFNEKELNKIMENGVAFAVEKGYGVKEDIEMCEDSGCIKGADASKVLQRAKGRGRNQLGTLGAGNHFLEIQEIESIYDEKTAEIFGLRKGQICVLIHSGSRGLGHQTASDYIKLIEKEYGFKHLPDRELAYAPIESKLGQDYLGAMRAAANFAFVNRHLIMCQVRKVFGKYFKNTKLDLVYDVAHNIVKFEKFKINGKEKELCVHRKGATRSFGKGRQEIPKKYRSVGQPIFIPGSMGTFSYVLVGTEKAQEISFASTAHGAGRVLSRTYAKKNITINHVKEELEKNDVYIEAGSVKGIVEEAPEAYKDVNEVVRVSHELGIGNLVARLKPLAVVKG